VTGTPAAPRSWLFIAGAVIPGLAALLFCAVGINEWWLISSGQIAVIPAPTPGVTEAQEVRAWTLLPFIAGSGAIAAAFGYALLRGSRKALIAGYGAVAVIAGMGYAARALASKGAPGVAEAVMLIIAVTLAAFVACLLGGAVYYAFKASQAGESLLEGAGRGLVKGGIAFVVLVAVVMSVLTVLGVLFIAYGLLTTSPSPSP